MGDFGPTHPEVGDCYSLLGRTYLVAGQTSEAEKAVRQAHRLISDQGSKDYLDLAILSGDLQVKRGDRRTATSFYDEALELRENEDPEISEMCARAYMARGRNKEGMGEQQGAVSDYGKAAEIYQRLGEREAAASARWEEFRLKEKIPREAYRLLQSERPTVRIAALELHEQRARLRPGRALARRGATSDPYWRQLIRDAHTQTALEEKEW
jgi:tetratricopeptide (TPR) repeat protein